MGNITPAIKYYERCDRIMRINFFTTLQRIVAVFFDMFLTGMLVAALLGTNSEFLFFIGIVIISLAFPFRDLIFGGRSIGKRVMRLHIINIDDRYDVMKIHKGKLVARDLLCYTLYPIEFFVLLFTGRTISDRVTKIAVVSGNLLDDNIMLLEEKQILKEREARIAKERGVKEKVYHNIYDERRPIDTYEKTEGSVLKSSDADSSVSESPNAESKEPKYVNIYEFENHRPQYDPRYEPRGLGVTGKIIIGLVVVALIIGGIGIAAWINFLNDDGYWAAYDYLVESYTFSGLKATEADIQFITEEHREVINHPNPQERITTEYHFLVKEQYLKVYCHEYNGAITVCRNCTQFK